MDASPYIIKKTLIKFTGDKILPCSHPETTNKFPHMCHIPMINMQPQYMRLQFHCVNLVLYFLSFLCSLQGAPKDNDGERGGSRWHSSCRHSPSFHNYYSQLIVENSYLLPNNPDVL